MEPEVIAFHGPSWHSRSSWRTVDMPYESRMTAYEGHARCNGGATGPSSAYTIETKGPPQPVEAFNFKCARHSTNAFDEKK